MFRKVFALAAIIAFSFCCGAEAVSVSWNGNGDGHSWSDPDNWNPDVVPFNTDTTSYSVSITNAHVDLSHGGTITSLDISGEVDLWSAAVSHILIDGGGLAIDPPYTFVDVGDSLELNDVHITHFIELANYGSIDFEHRSMIKEDLINYGDISISAVSDAGIDGELTNHDTIRISPSGNFNADGGIQNHAQFGIYGGLGGTDGAMNNDATGTLKGFGIFYADQQIDNAGEIIAWGGSLTVAMGGAFTNTGTLQSTELSPLIISPYMAGTPADIHNSGTIDIRTGGGVAIEGNLVNDTNGVIELSGGTFAATTITQSQNGIFQGFGSIAGDVVIEPNGIIELTAPTNIVGDVEIDDGATLEVSDGTTIITGHTTCNNGTIHMIGGRVICQGGLTNNGCDIIWEPGIDSNAADYNLDGSVNLEDYAQFAKTWLWEASWQ